jgi:hypothetical protein
MITRNQEDIVLAKHGLSYAMLKIHLMDDETFAELCSELDYRFSTDRDEQALVLKFVQDSRALSEAD